MSNGQSAPPFYFGFVPTVEQWKSYFSGKVDANTPIKSAAVTLALTVSGDYAFTGSSPTTWTLPLLSTQMSPFDLKNMGTALITLQGTTGEPLFFDSSVTSVQIAPGAGFRVVNFGDVWGLE